MNSIVLLTAIAAIFATFGIFLVAVGVAITARLESDRKRYTRDLNRALNEIENLKPPEQRAKEAQQRHQVEERNRPILSGDGI